MLEARLRPSSPPQAEGPQRAAIEGGGPGYLGYPVGLGNRASQDEPVLSLARVRLRMRRPHEAATNNSEAIGRDQSQLRRPILLFKPLVLLGEQSCQIQMR